MNRSLRAASISDEILRWSWSRILRIPLRHPTIQEPRPRQINRNRRFCGFARIIISLGAAVKIWQNHYHTQTTCVIDWVSQSPSNQILSAICHVPLLQYIQESVVCWFIQFFFLLKISSSHNLWWLVAASFTCTYSFHHSPSLAFVKHSNHLSHHSLHIINPPSPIHIITKLQMSSPLLP